MKKITIVGAGFLGSHVAEELAKLFYSQDLFPYQFRIIDYDHWEDRNAANQNVSLARAKTGEAKAVTCAEMAGQYGINNKAEAIVEKLTYDNMQDLLGDSELILDLVDNIPTRQLLWAAGISGGYGPVLHAGVSKTGNGLIMWSEKDFCTFPFRPQDVAGRVVVDDDANKELPCKMYRYRTAGLVAVQAIAKATALYLGKDPWGLMDGAEQERMMTCWVTDVNSAKLQTDAEYLGEDFFPVAGV
jgi:hypothetical protein